MKTPYMARLSSKALSRRGLLAGAAGLVTGAACRGSTRSAGSNKGVAAGSPTARRGGSLARSQTQSFDAVLDPHPLQPVYTSFYALFIKPCCNSIQEPLRSSRS